MTDAQIIEELRDEVAYLKHELAQLKRLIFGSKSERFVGSTSPEQLSLFEEESHEEKVGDQEREKISYERKKRKNHPGRNEIPEHLPVNEVIIEPEADTTGMVKIGEEITETLEYRPSSLIKRRTIRPKYIDKKSQRIHIGELPLRIIPKSIAEPSLLSYILISKYMDHLPLHRQAKMFERDFGWKVSQSTMVDWVRQCFQQMEALYEALGKRVLKSSYIQVDESPIKVLEYGTKGEVKGKSPPKKVMQGYQWVYYSPEERLVYFKYSKGRGMHDPWELLSEYEGYLQCDGYVLYDKIAMENRRIIQMGCLAHCRRYFDKAKDSDRRRSEYAMEIFRAVYEHERESKGMSMEERQWVRQEMILPKLRRLKEWIEEESMKVLPKSPIGKAMNYYQNQWSKVEESVKDARFEMDNNWIENEIRPLALGRKNYLFAGSHDGGKCAAMMYSFIGSCKRMGINPAIWIEETMEKLPGHPINRIEELLPGYQGKEPGNGQV
mgnify:CR=1 FL=1